MSSYVPRTLLIAFLTAVLAGCSSPNGAEQDPAAGGAGGGKGRGRGAGGGPVPVVTVKVEQKAVPVNIPAVGTVEAASTVQVRAQVTGQLSAVHFAEDCQRPIDNGSRCIELGSPVAHLCTSEYGEAAKRSIRRVGANPRQ